MISYQATLTTPHKTFQTKVQYDEDDDYIINLDNVIINLDNFELMFIFGDKYEIDQLTEFTWKEKIIRTTTGPEQLLLLSNTKLEVEIPIKVFNLAFNQKAFANLTIILESDEEGQVKARYKLLSQTSSQNDIDYALHELADKLKEDYHIEICGCCKNCETNPYGGSIFINQLCFKNNKEAFWALEDRSKHKIGALMKESEVYTMDILDRCDEFISNF